MKEQLINLLSQGITELRDLSHFLRISKKNLIFYLDELIEEKIIIQVNKERYGILKQGIVEIKSAGYGFIHVENEENDYYASVEELDFIFDGDTLLFFPYDDGSRLLNAHIIKVIERKHKFIIGTFHSKLKKGKLKYYIESSSASFPVKAVVKHGYQDVVDGMVVEASIEYVGKAIEASITQILGHVDDPGIEISQIALEYQFPLKFNEEVLEELKEIPSVVKNEEMLERRDFRNRLIFTIDGDDSKDFDDAISLTMDEEGNYDLGVYIADVAHYVKEDHPLDQEALRRGTSLYLADRVIPMLPHELSNGICSLNEGVDRLVLACLMKVSSSGNLLDYEICEGVIKSKHRMTYNEVNQILNHDENLCHKYSDLVETLNIMKELSSILRKKRMKKGALEFDVSEYKITLNQDGSPKNIIKRSQDDAEKLIEDFMLLANETVAYHMNIMNLPCIYRVHEKPDQEKLMNTISELSSMGISVSTTKKGVTSKNIQDILENLDNDSKGLVANQMLLRSMMKAKYSEACLGHYGLAMHYYCHFTSPIRRFPDLMVHRMIKKLCIHPKNYEEDRNHFEIIAPNIAQSTSKSERNAVECERAVNDMLFAWYMIDKIGLCYEGTITSLTGFGIFVLLDNGVEGMVSLSDLDGYFDYDAVHSCYTDGKVSYSLGQRVEIVVIDSDKSNRRIDFMMKCDYRR